MLIDTQLKQSLIDGLAAWQTTVPRERIVPLFGRVVPPKPYILYSIVRNWAHPGPKWEFNPPNRIWEALQPDTAPFVTGTTTDSGRSPWILQDRTKDFRALGVRPQDEVRVGTKTTRVFRIRTNDTLELYKPIAGAPGLAYEIRHQNIKAYYDKSGLRGCVVRVVASDPRQADELAHKVLEFFLLPSGAYAKLSPLGWKVASVGDLLSNDEVENDQVMDRMRELRVILRGRELLSEVQTPILTLDDGFVDEPPLNICDPNAPLTTPNDWRLYEPPIRIREV